MNGKEASEAVKYALDAGYRAVDSAQMYHNEKEVGSAIQSWLKQHPEVKREDIHYTTKLASNSDYDRARKSITKSVKECGLGYIDLFLLHSPYGGKRDRLESWRAVEDAIDAGEVRIGGVSNYGEKHVRPMSSLSPSTLLSRPLTLLLPTLADRLASDYGTARLLPTHPPLCQPNRSSPVQYSHSSHPILSET